MRRTIYLGMFIVLSTIAGLLYYSDTRQSTALVATRDLSVGTRIQDSDIAVHRINPASAPAGVLGASGQAVGQVVSSPILEGQFLDARQVAPSRNASLLGTGLDVPAGYRIIGLPIAPSAAVGGVLKPGDRVDVMAIPNPSKGVALVDESAQAPLMIGKNVLVIAMRTDQGTQVDQADRSLNIGNSKPGSVLLAIAPAEESAYSSAIASSSFVLALSTD
ncbi:MAG: RcpC/CpaB family pilus assembly protein [Candidatus Dormibacteraeota bacterium]|nr:RcpC/CpaB family pilus assembly protein [Candidatus Dormibacteraeota bacterium]